MAMMIISIEVELVIMLVDNRKTDIQMTVLNIKLNILLTPSNLSALNGLYDFLSAETPWDTHDTTASMLSGSTHEQVLEWSVELSEAWHGSREEQVVDARSQGTHSLT